MIQYTPLMHMERHFLKFVYRTCPNSQNSATNPMANHHHHQLLGDAISCFQQYHLISRPGIQISGAQNLALLLICDLSNHYHGSYSWNLLEKAHSQTCSYLLHMASYLQQLDYFPYRKSAYLPFCQTSLHRSKWMLEYKHSYFLHRRSHFKQSYYPISLISWNHPFADYIYAFLTGYLRPAPQIHHF